MSIDGAAGLLILVVAPVVAVIADIGCFYRVRLMYSATHDGVPSPRLSFRLGIRHLFLALATFSIVYLHEAYRRNIDYALAFLFANIGLYAVFIYIDAERASNVTIK